MGLQWCTIYLVALMLRVMWEVARIPLTATLDSEGVTHQLEEDPACDWSRSPGEILSLENFVLFSLSYSGIAPAHYRGYIARVAGVHKGHYSRCDFPFIIYLDRLDLATWMSFHLDPPLRLTNRKPPGNT